MVITAPKKNTKQHSCSQNKTQSTGLPMIFFVTDYTRKKNSNPEVLLLNKLSAKQMKLHMPFSTATLTSSG